LKLSIRPPLATVRSRPVYAGWQLEQMSTEILCAVDPMLNDVPHYVQRTSTRCRLGCCVPISSLGDDGVAKRVTPP
jgi:hypothetical protein